MACIRTVDQIPAIGSMVALLGGGNKGSVVGGSVGGVSGNRDQFPGMLVALLVVAPLLHLSFEQQLLS